MAENEDDDEEEDDLVPATPGWEWSRDGGARSTRSGAAEKVISNQ